MKPVVKTLKFHHLEYYKTHLSIINCLLPVKMTENEIKILSLFMSFSGELADDKFGVTGRKIIRENLRITHAGLSNYIASLMKKGCIVDDNGKLKILSILHPDNKEQSYMIKLINGDV